MDDPIANETWFSKTWRPAMAWQYWFVCLCDFVFFPVANAAFFGDTKSFHDWKPLTLQGGGLYHLSMGALLGVTSWQRSQEKITAMRSGGGSYTESTTTQTTVAKEPAAPTKVDIKTDNVDVKANTATTTSPSSRSD